MRDRVFGADRPKERQTTREVLSRRTDGVRLNSSGSGVWREYGGMTYIRIGRLGQLFVVVRPSLHSTIRLGANATPPIAECCSCPYGMRSP